MFNQCSIVAVLLIVLSGCTPEVKPVPEARPVRTMVVGGALPVAAEVYSGEIKARHEVALGFRIPGKLIARSVDVGAKVTKGQVLAKLDAGDVALNANVARAGLASAQAQLAQAAIDYKRAQELHAQNFVSQAEIDKRQTARIFAQKQMEQAKAQLDLANNQAGYAQLLAESDGVVTKALVEPGSVLAAGQPVLLIAKTGAYEAVIDVTENRVQAWQVGQKVKVVLWADDSALLDGVVNEVSPAADPQTRTYRVKVTLPEDTKVAMGMTVQVKQVFASSDIHTDMSVPMSAVYGKEKAMRVWIVDAKNTVHSREVTVLGYQDQLVRIKGVAAGAVVVTAGVHLLREGQVVKLLAPQGV